MASSWSNRRDRTIFVTGLDSSVNDDIIYDTFKSMGPIEKVIMRRDPFDNPIHAIVVFRDRSSLTQVLQLRCLIGNKEVSIRPYRELQNLEIPSSPGTVDGLKSGGGVPVPTSPHAYTAMIMTDGRPHAPSSHFSFDFPDAPAPRSAPPVVNRETPAFAFPPSPIPIQGQGFKKPYPVHHHRRGHSRSHQHNHFQHQQVKQSDYRRREPQPSQTATVPIPIFGGETVVVKSSTKSALNPRLRTASAGLQLPTLSESMDSLVSPTDDDPLENMIFDMWNSSRTTPTLNAPGTPCSTVTSPFSVDSGYDEGDSVRTNRLRLFSCPNSTE